MRESYYVPKSPFAFAPAPDGGGVVAVAYQGRARHVVLPAIHENQPVVAIGEEAFQGRADILTVTLPDTVRLLGRRAFYGCGGLKSVVFGNGLREIGPEAFGHCSALTTVVLPAGLRRVAQRALDGCDSLADIRVHPGNPCLCDIDGVLFSKDGRLLLQYPGGRHAPHYRLPKATRGIAVGAFGQGTRALRKTGWLQAQTP